MNQKALRLRKKPIYKKYMACEDPIVFGIDPSLTSTGVVILDKNKNVLGERNIVTTTKNTDAERLAAIKRVFSKLLADNTAMATGVFAFVEDYAMNRIMGKMFTRAEGAGLIKHELYLAGVPTYLIAPQVLKNHITGSGVADKKEIISGVDKLYGYKTTISDMADAFSLASLGIDMINKGVWVRHKKYCTGEENYV